MEHYSERRPATCPQESLVFPTCGGGGARPLPDTPNQTVERDWRQAMPRAEPTLSRALLHLSAVAGAAITTAITTPVTPSGPPPRTADTGRVSWGQPPSGYPGESPGADLVLRHAHCHDVAHGKPCQ